MKKALVPFVLALVFAAVPVATFAACAQVLVMNGGGQKQTCFLTSEYTINGVEFCEYGDCQTTPIHD